MLACVDAVIPSGRLATEPEGLVVLWLTEYEHAVPPLLFRNFQAFADESTPDAVTLPVRAHSNGRQSERAHGRLEPAEEDVPHDFAGLSRHQRNLSPTSLPQRLNQGRLGCPPKRNGMDRMNCGPICRLFGRYAQMVVNVTGPRWRRRVRAPRPHRVS